MEGLGKMKFIFAILLSVVVSNEVLAETCGPDLSYYTNILKNRTWSQMEAIQNAREDWYEKCKIPSDEIKCINNLSKSSEDTRISSYLKYMKLFCGENMNVSVNKMDIVSCSKKNVTEFEKCSSTGKNKHDVDAQDICGKLDSMLCLAELSIEQKCKEGEVLGKPLKDGVDILMSGVCSGVSYLANSFWTIATTVLSVLLIRIKL